MQQPNNTVHEMFIKSGAVFISWALLYIVSYKTKLYNTPNCVNNVRNNYKTSTTNRKVSKLIITIHNEDSGRDFSKQSRNPQQLNDRQTSKYVSLTTVRRGIEENPENKDRSHDKQTVKLIEREFPPRTVSIPIHLFLSAIV